jgi:hypothetical protein
MFGQTVLGIFDGCALSIGADTLFGDASGK